MRSQDQMSITYYLTSTRTEEKPNQGRGMQCHKCEGFGHIRSKWSTYLKKRKEFLLDSDTKGDPDEETTKHESDEVSCDQDLSYKEMTASHKKLCVTSEECARQEKRKRIITQLQDEIEKFLSTVSYPKNKVTFYYL